MTDPREDIGRSMPCSPEAEQGVISCLLFNPVGMAEAAMGLSLDLFYHARHRLLASVIVDFIKAGKPPDILLLTHHFLDTEQIDKIGGAAELAYLCNLMPGVESWGYYVGILEDKLRLRTVIIECTTLIQDSYRTYDEDSGAMLDRALANLYALKRKGTNAKRLVPIKEVVIEVSHRTDAMLAAKGHVPPGALATGFTDLDRRTMGLRGGEFVIVGARPAMGKTSLVMNFVENIAMAQGHYKEFNQVAKGVLVITLEMSRHDLTERTMVSRSGVNFGLVRTGMFNQRDGKSFMTAGLELAESPIWFLDTGVLTVQELPGIVRHAKTVIPNLVLVVIDYLQRMRSSSKKAAGNRSVEIGEISSGCKGVAKDEDIVVMGLAQVGRSAEERKGCVPSLGDLRESGDLEADADWVGLLHRPGYYEQQKAGGNRGGDDDDEIDDTRAQLIIAKARRGSVEPIDLEWCGWRTRFQSKTGRLFSNNEEQREGNK